MSTSNEQQYLDSLRHVLDRGVHKGDRTGTGTYSIFGSQARYNLRESFPLLTTKKIHLKSVIHELLWFLKGDTNTKYLKENGVRIWDEWAVKEEDANNALNIDVLSAMHCGAIVCPPTFEGMEWSAVEKWFKDAQLNIEDFKFSKSGDLGPVYGKQWRDWVTPQGEHIDQISKVIDQLKNDPDSRRIIVSAWNVGELDQMALAPCHSFFQFYTRELSIEERGVLFKQEIQNNVELLEEYGDKVHPFINDREQHTSKLTEMIEKHMPKRELSCQLYQRSMDKFLGEPFNIASYALLTHMIAQQVNMVVGDLVHTAGDAHIYSNHLEQVKEQLSRTPRPAPKLVIKRKPDSIFDYQFEDFEFVGYDPMDAIKAPVAI